MPNEKRIVRIDSDEWYPVFSMYTDKYHYGYDVEIPEDKVEWIERVQNEFEEVQNYLLRVYNAQVRSR